MADNPAFASVLLDLGIDHPLDYLVPKEYASKAEIGVRVQVPLKNEIRTGTIIALNTLAKTEKKILPIAGILQESSFPEDLFTLAKWMSDYYLTPLRKILKSFLPTVVRQNSYQPQTQYFVKALAAKQKLREACQLLRNSHTAQADVLDCILQHDKGLFLTQLLELTGVSRSPVDTLVNKKLIQLQQVTIDRSPLIQEEYFKTTPKTLNSQQQEALNALTSSLAAKQFSTYLLHGVTGSGKTEVYLQAIQEALNLGLSAIMLVPEISLTEQTIRRLRGRFEGQIAILHHRLSQGERHDQWHRIRKGEAKIVVGARSALFSPIHHLGLIIVDEEHDNAYKQTDERPTYHARDMAVMRGKLTNSVVVLGSATPSMESMYNVHQNKYRLLALDARATQAQLPKVTIVDMKKEYERAGRYTSFCELLIEKMQDRLDKGEQTILFLNRRGYHTSMQCQSCGYIFKCPHCDLALTFHLGHKKLACHLCGYCHTPPPKQCSACHSEQDIKFKGVGTEQIERAIHALLPQARTLRIDGDTTKHKGSHERLLKQFRTGKSDILIGTQMIAKGLHFPSVTLVAILNADSALNIPDFKASEHTFQLITQVAGRAGREELEGEVIIQTQLPNNPTICYAAAQDYQSFYQQELMSRSCFGFPPFSHLAKCTFIGEDPVITQQEAERWREQLATHLSLGSVLYPVAAAGYAKIKDRYRFQFLIRSASMQLVGQAICRLSPPKHCYVHVDIDTISTFF